MSAGNATHSKAPFAEEIILCEHSTISMQGGLSDPPVAMRKDVTNR